MNPQGDAARRSRLAHKERIEASLEVISRILSEGITARRRVVKLLEEAYRRHAIQPIRGKAWPPDIWDKEMATLYAVAKYALLLNEEKPELFHQIFSVEEALEEAAETIIREEDTEKAGKYVAFLLGGSIDSNTIARMLRVIATQVVLGFRDERDMELLVRKLPKVLPEAEETARKYARYYIALRLAQAIAVSEVRDRISKEAYKQALAARIGLPKVMPDDEYVEFIARTVYGVPKKKLERILARKEGGSAAGSPPIAPKRGG